MARVQSLDDYLHKFIFNEERKLAYKNTVITVYADGYEVHFEGSLILRDKSRETFVLIQNRIQSLKDRERSDLEERFLAELTS